MDCGPALDCHVGVVEANDMADRLYNGQIGQRTDKNGMTTLLQLLSRTQGVEDWSHEWIGSLDDGSGDWNRVDNDWRSWNEDRSWNSRAWQSTEQRSSNMPSSSQANASQEATRSEPSQVAGVIIEAQDQNAPPSSIRGAKFAILLNLLHGACLLIGALSAGVPPAPPKNCERLIP